MDADNGSKVGLTCTMGEDGDEEVLLCTLREGATESQSLDLVFDHYTEFKVQGSAAVHLTGYYMPEYEEGVCLPFWGSLRFVVCVQLSQRQAAGHLGIALLNRVISTSTSGSGAKLADRVWFWFFRGDVH